MTDRTLTSLVAGPAALTDRAQHLVETTKGLIAAGTPWRQAAETIQREASGDHPALQEAVLHWLQVMHARPSGDLAATAGLRALARALARTPRPVPVP